MAGAAAKRQFRIPPKPRLTPACNVHCPSIPSKTRPIRRSDIAASQAVTEVSYDVQFLMKGAIGGIPTAAIPPLLGHPLWAIRRIAHAAPAGFARLFAGALREPVDERLGCPANSVYPRSL
jgi:hypothetical protein